MVGVCQGVERIQMILGPKARRVNHQSPDEELFSLILPLLVEHQENSHGTQSKGMVRFRRRPDTLLHSQSSERNELALRRCPS